MKDFMVSKHRNKAFILLLSNYGQSQLHFGTKIYLGRGLRCHNKIIFCRQKQKIEYFTKTLKPPHNSQKGNIFAFKGKKIQ